MTQCGPSWNEFKFEHQAHTVR